MLDRALKENLERLQFAEHERVILINQLPIGYGGQLSMRLLGLKIGLALGRKAIFLDDADFPYIQSISGMFSWPHDPALAADWPLLELREPDPRPLARFDYFAATKKLGRERLTVEEWVNRQLEEKLNLTMDDLQKLDGWLIRSLQFVPDFERRLAADVTRLGVSKDALGVHVRRGDKKVETAYVPLETINEAIRRIYAAWKFTRVFVATDSEKAVRDLKLPQGVRLLFDRDETRHNNANHKMLLAYPEMAAEETYVAFKNFRLLCECGGIVGQDNAHFATMAASYIFHRDSSAERIHLIDPNQGTRAAVLMSRLKWRFRTIVKATIPRSALVRLDHILVRLDHIVRRRK
jgi:hypothetical protein